MDCTATRIPYRQTNYFSKLVLDYIDQLPEVQPFYAHPVSLTGIQDAIKKRKQFPTNRKVLVQELQKQYAAVEQNKLVQQNIDALLDENTFTIVTAHQNNIFTGPLYFIYKIVHCIKLADFFKKTLPAFHFVPVFYIGSEDADLEELNHIFVGEKNIVWNTTQTGAVGRMKIDQAFLEVITEIEKQLLVQPFGEEIMTMVKDAYREGLTIEEATFRFVHALFAEFGLVVLKPDNAVLKKEIIEICEDDLLNQTASAIVQKSIDTLQKSSYKVQAQPREINLFYLKDNFRERIIFNDENFHVLNTDWHFTKEDMLEEIKNHPERFSPNVIIRGIYQERILPNIAFIGGGGELAYWLQLKSLFENYQIPFPVLVVRNSFLMIEKSIKMMLAKLEIPSTDVFIGENLLMKQIVEKDANTTTNLTAEIERVQEIYKDIQAKAIKTDATLAQHVAALKTKAIDRIIQLEKKMLRAEKRKFATEQQQVKKIKNKLFPADSLQERKENILYYYAKFGKSFLQILYQNSLSLEQEFVILAEKD